MAKQAGARSLGLIAHYEMTLRDAELAWAMACKVRRGKKMGDREQTNWRDRGEFQQQLQECLQQPEKTVALVRTRTLQGTRSLGAWQSTSVYAVWSLY